MPQILKREQELAGGARCSTWNNQDRTRDGFQQGHAYRNALKR